jgi:uncharacterized protein YkwD
MKKYLLMIAMAATTLSAQPTMKYSHGEPTNDEQYMLELINRARKDPTAEGIRLMDTDDAAVQSAYTYWKINKATTKAAFATYPQRAPLAFHPDLIEAARVHTADMVENNFQGHTGSNGSSLGQRYQAAGYASQGMYGENVSAYSNSVWYAHCGLNVDWGDQNQIDLGHRSNIMNFDNFEYTEIGIAITKTTGGLMQGTVGPYVVTQDFGLRSQKFIVGVVYEDKNNNSMYDPGEGLEGVDVRPTKGSWYAVTSASGGYAIPFSSAGTDVLTASGGGLGTQTKDVVFSGSNVKVDFVKTSTAPGNVALISPANQASDVALRPQLRWSAATNATHYSVQISKAAQFTDATIVDTAFVTTTTWTPSSPLRCAAPYWWRVRARSATQSGAWSAPFLFTTEWLANPKPSIIAPNGAVTITLGEPLTLTFTHQAFSYDVKSAQIRISASANMAQPFVDTTIAGTSFDWYPTERGTFYWRARINDDCGFTPYSDVAEIRLSVTSVDEEYRIDPVVSTQYFDLLGRVVPAETGGPLLRVTRTLTGRTHTERVWGQTSVK